MRILRIRYIRYRTIKVITIILLYVGTLLMSNTFTTMLKYFKSAHTGHIVLNVLYCIIIDNDSLIVVIIIKRWLQNLRI